MIWRKIHLFLRWHWVKLSITAAVVILLVLAVWGLTSLESFYLHLTLATLPLQLLLVALNAVIFVYFYMVVLRGGFAQVNKGSVDPEQVNVRFSDVIGIDEAKEEAWEVVQLIKDRTRLKSIGGRIIRGLLLVGPPGCGKTYLAKAIASEAGVPFLSMSGSEFVEVFVGVGASKVRKLFQKARQFAYAHGACIVFIDELDAIARRRVFSVFGGTEETNSTQNQLLAEMDGLKEREEAVIVIGATNAAEGNLDDALLRPGRFDRKIFVDRPGLDGRQKLFDFYLNRVKHDASIDVSLLARKAVYKTPADIMNIVRESALIAARNSKPMVGYKEISEAIERIELGIKHKKHMSPREREMTAYHESGHLVTLYLIHPTDDVFKASIVSRGGALGVVHHQPREELFTENKEELLADIKVSIAGYVAERIQYRTTSTGVAMDFQVAMHKAHQMVWKAGMGDTGYIGDFTVIPEHQVSDEIKQALNEDVQRIMKRCMEEVDRLLKQEWPIVERCVKELLAKEELEYDEIDAIFAEYGKSHVQVNGKTQTGAGAAAASLPPPPKPPPAPAS